MRIGVPKEIKNHEYRVGMTPAAVRELTARGHEVFVETNAGDAIDLSDEKVLAGIGKDSLDILARSRNLGRRCHLRRFSSMVKSIAFYPKDVQRGVVVDRCLADDRVCHAS